VKGKWHLGRSDHGSFIEGRITNAGKVPAIQVRLTLRDAKTGLRILPVYYDDNYICLLPGETRDFRIEFKETDAAKHPKITLDGWNIKPSVLR
jgi:hypothetical protein